MKLSERVSNEFLRACIKSGIILDTNVFLQAFTQIEADKEEKRIVKSIVGYCANKGGSIILTPHILAEITNLAINRPRKGIVSTDIERVIVVLNEVKEHYSTKDIILCQPEFSRFGFADLSIKEACKELSCGVLTNDKTLHADLVNECYFAMNTRELASQSLVNDLFCK